MKYKGRLAVVILLTFCIIISMTIHRLYFTSDIVTVSNAQMEYWMSQELVILRTNETMWEDLMGIELLKTEIPAMRFINNTDYYFIYNPGWYSLFVANRNRWEKVDHDFFADFLAHILPPYLYNTYPFNPALWWNLASGEYRIVFDMTGYNSNTMSREDIEIPSLKVVGAFTI